MESPRRPGLLSFLVFVLSLINGVMRKNVIYSLTLRSARKVPDRSMFKDHAGPSNASVNGAAAAEASRVVLAVFVTLCEATRGRKSGARPSSWPGHSLSL